jgi:hypothetical protein
MFPWFLRYSSCSLNYLRLSIKMLYPRVDNDSYQKHILYEKSLKFWIRYNYPLIYAAPSFSMNSHFTILSCHGRIHWLSNNHLLVMLYFLATWVETVNLTLYLIDNWSLPISTLLPVRSRQIRLELKLKWKLILTRH